MAPGVDLTSYEAQFGIKLHFRTSPPVPVTRITDWTWGTDLGSDMLDFSARG